MSENDSQPVIFIVSDTHFHHANIIQHTDRPFKDVKEQNEVLVSNWNSVVRPCDIVIHLGDFTFGGKDEHLIIKLLNGRKILVKGNHDCKSNEFYLCNGWDFVCNSFVWGTILFTHKPVDSLKHGLTLNVHGHTHNKNYGRGRGWVNVSIEKTSFKPIRLSKVLQRHLRRY